MRLFCFGLLITFLLNCTDSVAQKKIVVLGSSTAAGSGAWPIPDSSWVGRLQAEYRKNNTVNDVDTTIINLAVSGTTTYIAMPTGFIPPAGRPLPDTAHNVTKALSFLPDVVIINFPTNDIGSSYTANEYMNNLRLLYNQVIASGVKAFIATTQPRGFDYEKRLILRQLVDSITNNFGEYAINFWDDIVTDDGSYLIRAEVNSGDNTHVNNLGHWY